MSGSGRLPGLRLAIGAFVVTVLLGVGGGSASALWHQSATATMTVTAASEWPTITVTCGSTDKKKPKMNVTVTSAPTQLTFFALASDGTPLLPIQTGPSLAAPGTALIDLDNNPIFKDKPSKQDVNVRVSASQVGQASISADLTFTIEAGKSGITC